MFQFLKSSYQKIKGALAKTRQALGARLASLFKAPWDEATFEHLEQILYEADLGTVCSAELVEEVRLFLKKNRDAALPDLLAFLREEALRRLSLPSKVHPRTPLQGDPLIILVVGVNGSGKTTSIAKLAHAYQKEGKKVLVAAGDTFRAAAIEQLTTWAERLGIDIVKSAPGSDPAAVAFDALTAAKARGIDVVLIDTAGRLQNKTDLMRELEKVTRVMTKVYPTAPHETLLVLDATTGQNAIDQATVFHSFTPLTGIILAKLDGSAKGGIVLAIYQKLGIPVRWVGVGEGIDDLMPFDATAYADALFSE